MSTTAMHPLAADYLRRLRQAGRALPAGRLDDLCAEIESHLAEAIPAGASDAQALSVIERLGPPEDIVEAEAAPSPPAPGKRGWHEIVAVVLLLLGGFVFGVGWIAGVVLLWTSRVWSIRDKLIGTLIVPGGLAAVFPVLLIAGEPTKHICKGVATEVSPVFRPGRMHCISFGGPSGAHHIVGIVLVAIVVAGSIFTAIYLSRRASPARSNG